MFTGIIEEIGMVKNIHHNPHSVILEIEASNILNGTNIGDSIAVNGVCLTVTSFSSHAFQANVMHETINRSSLASLTNGSRVNLERALLANGRFGGHIVSGHIDGTGHITKIQKDDNAFWFFIQAPPAIMHYIVEKGSVAIDGISLTVATVSSDTFSVSIIPHTIKNTILYQKKVRDVVNIETDIIGKYVMKMLDSTNKSNRISMDFLAKNGFLGG